MSLLELAGSTVFDRVVEASWQASVLGLLVLTVQWALRKRLSAHWRYWLWGIVVVRLALPVLPPSPTSMYSVIKPDGVRDLASRPVRSPQPETEVYAPPPFQAPLAEPDAQYDVSPPSEGRASLSQPLEARSSVSNETSRALPGREPLRDPGTEVLVPLGSEARKFGQTLPWAWAVGAGLLVIVGGFRGARVSRKLRHAPQVRDPRVLRILDACRAILGVGGGVQILETPLVHGPALFGLLAPRILVPPGLLQMLGEDQLRHVLIHELAHKRRGDLVVNQLLSLLLAMHWFNPVVHILVRRIRADMESACDATVLQRMEEESGRAYGRSILSVLESLHAVRPLPGSLGVVGGRGELWRRFRAIVEHPYRKGYGWAAALAALGLAVVGLTAPRALRQPESQPGANSEESQKGLEVIAWDAAADQPVPSARVRWKVSGASTGEVSGEQTSDAVGRLRLPLPDEQVTDLTVTVQAPDYWPWTFELNPSRSARGLDSLQASLLKVSPVGGRVVDLNTNPVEGAVVRLTVEAVDDWYFHLGTASHAVGVLEAVTGSDGYWHIEEAISTPTRSSGTRAHLEVRHADYVGGFQVWGSPRNRQRPRGGYSVTRDPIAEWPMTTNMALLVGKVRDLTGRIVTDDGEPIVGATITHTPALLAPPSGDPQSLSTNILSDAQGQFSISAVSPVVLPFSATHFQPQVQWGWLKVEAEGFAARSIRAESPDAQGILPPILLEPGFLIRAQLVDENDRPVANRRLDWRSEGSGGNGVRTAQDGRFVVGPVANAAEEVSLTVEGQTRKLQLSETEQVVRITLAPQIRIEAFEAETGLPIEQFDAYLIRSAVLLLSWQGLRLPDLQPGISDQSVVFPRLSTTNGTITIPAGDAAQTPGMGPLGRLGAETWWIKIEAKGYLPAVSEGFSPTDGASVSVSLTPESWYEGTVLSPDGEPVVGATVGYVADPYPADHVRLNHASGFAGWLIRLKAQGETGASVSPRDGMKLEFPLCLQTPQAVETDSEGRFSLPPRNPQIAVVKESPFEPPMVLPSFARGTSSETNDFIVVAHEQGIAEIPVRGFRSPQTIQLLPLGALRIKAGRYPEQVEGWHPAVSRKPLSVVLADPGEGGGPGDLRDQLPRPQPGSAGEWLIQDLPPGPCLVRFSISSGPNSRGSREDYSRHVEVLPGVTNEFEFFTSTLSLKGRFQIDLAPELVNWQAAPRGPSAQGLSRSEAATMPLGLFALNEESERESTPFVSPLYIEQDGQFKVAAVEPGDYMLRLMLVESSSQIDHHLLPPLPAAGTGFVGFRGSSGRRTFPGPGAMRDSFSIWEWTERSGQRFLHGFLGGVPAAGITKQITVPPSGGSSSEAPIDLGDLELELYERLKLGQAAPEIRIQRPERSFDLQELLGKWTLLIFTSGSIKEREEQTLAKYADELKAAGKVEVVVFDLDAEPPPGFEPRGSVASDLPWEVIPLGPWKESQVATAYCVRALPEVILLDPEGRIAGLHLRGQQMLNVLDAISPSPGAPYLQP